MAAHDLYHDVVVKALVADGWAITHDPFTLAYGGRDLYADLGAANTTLGAARGDELVAVIVRSFVGASALADFEAALGQYALHQAVLAETQPARRLHLAVPRRVYVGFFSEALGQLVVRAQRIALLVFDERVGRVERWVP